MFKRFHFFRMHSQCVCMMVKYLLRAEKQQIHVFCQIKFSVQYYTRVDFWLYNILKILLFWETKLRQLHFSFPAREILFAVNKNILNLQFFRFSKQNLICRRRKGYLSKSSLYRKENFIWVYIDKIYGNTKHIYGDHIHFVIYYHNMNTLKK